MAEAEVGDDVYGEDPTVNRLERTAAELMGKEAGMFVASGTMGNLVSALAWCSRGDELICGVDAHLIVNEMGAIAAFGGVQMRALPNDHRGLMDPDVVESTISPGGFFPRTALLTIENTHNRGNGAAYTVEQMQPLTGVARAHGMAVHMDGARILNASVALGVPLRNWRPLRIRLPSASRRASPRRSAPSSPAASISSSVRAVSAR